MFMFLNTSVKTDFFKFDLEAPIDSNWLVT